MALVNEPVRREAKMRVSAETELSLGEATYYLVLKIPVEKINKDALKHLQALMPSVDKQITELKKRYIDNKIDVERIRTRLSPEVK